MENADDLSKKIQILIIDDSPTTQQLFKNWLVKENFEVLAAENGNDGIRLALQEQPDLILLDVMMPEMDGFEVCKRLKENNKTEAIPVIIVTGIEKSDDIIKLFRLGAVDYLVKPIDNLQLNTRIKLSLKIKEFKERERKNILRLEKTLKAQDLLLTISHRFINSERFEHDINLSLQNLVDFSDISRSSIYKFNKNFTECELIYEGVKNEEAALNPELHIFNSSELNNIIEKISKNEIVVIDDFEDLKTVSQNEYDFFKIRNTLSSIIMPLYIDERVYGFITFSYIGIKHKWQDYEISAVKIAAEIISKGFSNYLKSKQLNENIAQLVQSAKLASIGTMVAGVAHEINNPNSFITLNIPIISECWEELKKFIDERSSIKINNSKVKIEMVTKYIKNIDKSLEHITAGSDRIQNIVNTLKEFSQYNESPNKNYFSIKECIEKAYTIVGAMIRRKVFNVDINIADNIPKISGNQIKIEQVIINLLQNSADAAYNKNNGYINLSCGVIDNKIIRIIIKDNGSGIKKTNMSKIFEPFFTTKHEFAGTGLGLAISYKIIKEHNGSISVISEENEGTVFIIDLPIADKTVVPDIQPTVIIVDDEIQCLNMFTKLFEFTKLKCIPINNPLEVIKTIESNINSVDIIITDIMMPDINGFDLLKQIKDKFPWIKFICMSGAINEKKIEGLIELGAKAFFHKPFECAQLIKKVRELR